MPYALTLCLAESDAAPIRRLWQALGEAGFGDVGALGYRPHVTLGVWPEAPDPAALLPEAVEGLILEFVALGVFPGALVALPTPTAALLAAQTRWLAGLPPPHPHYRPGAWVPHASLAKAIAPGAIGTAVQAANTAWTPFRARCDALEVVRFRPVARLARRDLGE